MFNQAKLSLRKKNLRTNEVKICERLKIVTLDVNLLVLIQKKILLHYCV